MPNGYQPPSASLAFFPAFRKVSSASVVASPSGARTRPRQAVPRRRWRKPNDSERSHPSSRASWAVGTPWANPRTIRTSSTGRRLVACRAVPVNALKTRRHALQRRSRSGRGDSGGRPGRRAPRTAGRPGRGAGATGPARRSRRPHRSGPRWGNPWHTPMRPRARSPPITIARGTPGKGHPPDTPYEPTLHGDARGDSPSGAAGRRCPHRSRPDHPSPTSSAQTAWGPLDSSGPGCPRRHGVVAMVMHPGPGRSPRSQQ